MSSLKHTHKTAIIISLHFWIRFIRFKLFHYSKQARHLGKKKLLTQNCVQKLRAFMLLRRNVSQTEYLIFEDSLLFTFIILIEIINCVNFYHGDSSRTHMQIQNLQPVGRLENAGNKCSLLSVTMYFLVIHEPASS